jgi:hypothetical protein
MNKSRKRGEGGDHAVAVKGPPTQYTEAKYFALFSFHTRIF